MIPFHDCTRTTRFTKGQVRRTPVVSHTRQAKKIEKTTKYT